MKEKHQMLTNGDGNVNSIDENEKSCSYCLTNSVHPRLSRGEQYPCGFKPYRCDLCLYSTTTKGNLAIHMQSDKHMNNSKDFTSTSSSTLLISSPSNSSEDQFIQSQGLFLFVFHFDQKLNSINFVFSSSSFFFSKSDKKHFSFLSLSLSLSFLWCMFFFVLF